jgi:RNA-splicing ligase RtcB
MRSVRSSPSPDELVRQVAALRQQVVIARTAGELDEETADDVSRNLAKAEELAATSDRNRATIVGRLNAARALMDGAAAATRSVGGLALAIAELAQHIQPRG